MAVDVSRIPNNSKFDPVREAILDLQQEISSGVAGVSSINNQTGGVTIAQGSNVSITTNNGVITISSTASGGGGGIDGSLTLAAGDGISLSSPSVFDGTTDLTVTITNTEIPNDGELTISAGSGLTIAGGEVWTDIVDNWSIETNTWASSVGATFSANQSDNANINIQHGNTSSVADAALTGGNVIQSMSFDEFGHVQSRTPVNLDNRYLAYRTIFTEDDGGSLSAQTYNDTLTLNGSPSISVTTDTVNNQIYFALSLNDISFDPDGNLIARGLLYYQEVGEPSVSDLPTATFNFENATIDLSGPNANKWSENAPRTGTALTTLWVVRYQSIDTGAGTSAARTVTFGSIIEATGFEGPVTFSDFESGGRTIIDGGRIQTGSISSNGFQVGSTPTDFSTEGTKWFLEGNGQNAGGDIISEQFKITSGNAAFKGDVTGASGTFGTVDFNKNGYLINAAGFQLDLNGAVTIGGSKFNIPIYADDAIGTNKSFTLQAGQEYVLFYASNVPQDQLDINTVTGTWVKFIGDDGATGATGTAGLSTFLASIYRRSSTIPSTPTGGSYNFGTTTLTPPSGWSNTIPSGTDPLYVSTALASIQGTTGIDSSLNWSSPVILARDGEDGSAGANARAVNLTMDDQSFEYSVFGTNPSPSTAIVTATAINTTGTVYYEFFLNDVSQQNSTSNTYAYTAPASYSSMPQKIEVQIREGSSSAPILARDQITAFGIQAGEDAYTIILTNEAHTLPTTNTGVVTYTGSGTSIIVYKGTTELNGVTSGTPTAGQFRVTATGTNITVGSITSVGNPVVVGNHSNMTADAASVSFSINIENQSTFTKIQSLSKSKQGQDGVDGADGADGAAGVNARAVNLIADDQSFEYSVAGTNPSPASATVTASALNTSGTVYYEFFLNDISQQNTTSNTYSYTPKASYFNMPDKIEVQIRENSPTSSVLARDQITMFGIKAGADGTDGTDGRDAYTIILTNEAHTLPTTNAGVVTYTGSGTQIIVYRGLTELNGITSGTPTTGQFRVTAVGSNITVGTISSPSNPVIVGNHSNMTADLAAVTFTINVENQFSFTKTQSLSKSKEGEDGEVGPAGPQGPQGPQGLTGDDGIRTSTGLVFYQLGSSTTPSTPSASYFNFSTGAFVGLTSNWATTTPDMEAGTSTNRYYSSYYVATETSSGSGIGSVTFQTPIRAFSFNQVVTFSSLSTSGSTIINGDNITTGVISSADYVSQSGSVFSASGMAIDLLNDSIETPNFAVDTSGNAFFSAGKIQIGSNKIALQADNFYSALGTIEFQNETGAVAADMKVTSYGKNEVTLASYLFGTFKGNQLIVGEDRFFIGDSNNAFIRTETVSFLDYMIFNSNYYQLRGLLGVTSSPANLFMDTNNNNQLSRSTSSRKYKTDITDYDKGIDKIKELRPVYYKGKDDGDKIFSGLIAEEVHEAGLEEFVLYDSEGQPDALAYQNMVSLLIKGMQEQQEQIELLKSEIENLKNKL